jgi:hypothetical protein
MICHGVAECHTAPVPVTPVTPTPAGKPVPVVYPSWRGCDPAYHIRIGYLSVKLFTLVLLSSSRFCIPFYTCSGVDTFAPIFVVSTPG